MKDDIKEKRLSADELYDDHATLMRRHMSSCIYLQLYDDSVPPVIPYRRTVSVPDSRGSRVSFWRLFAGSSFV